MAGLLRAAALGAGCMFFLDPARGKRRRALIRDQVTHLSRRTGDFFDKALRDAQHRIEGTIAELSAAGRNEQVTDDVLVARVRSRIGRYVSHPRSLAVSASEGRVVLSGSVREEEASGLLNAVWGVRGVRDVDDRTTPSLETDSAPEQGAERRWGDHPETLQVHWTPATRLFLGAAGTWLMLNCLVRRSPAAIALGTLGFGLVLNSMADCAAGTNASRREAFGTEMSEEIQSMASTGGEQRSRAPK